MSTSGNSQLSSNYLIYQQPINNLFSTILENFELKTYFLQTGAADTVEFLNNYIPSLKEGRYRLDFTQSASINGGTPITAYTNSQQIYVKGPQFQINPKDIVAVYPPAHSSGDHAYVLPHISFSRETIPWEVERAALPWVNGDEPGEEDQWLALFVFSDTEIPAIESETLSSLGLADGFNAGDEKVNTITITQDLVEKTFPQAQTIKQYLPFLAHVRERGDDQVAYVVSNRLPQTNTTSVVHLVSLANILPSPGPEGAAYYKFISLYNWTFYCEEDKPTFKEILTKVDPHAFRLYQQEEEPLPAGEVVYSIQNKYYLKGYVPMPHYIRKGETTLSWYRGPFVPDPGCIKDPGLGLANSADDYLQFDSGGSNMLLVSYASAWQIGRMLTLKNKDVAIAIQNFKREVAQLIKSQTLNPDAVDPANYLSFLQQYTFTSNQQNIIACIQQIDADPGGETPAVCSQITIESKVAKWIADLILLKPIPFTYLVPNNTMLPQESIRFFVLDPFWITFLLEGAFSMGDERLNLDIPEWLGSGGVKEGANEISKYFSGFLLRSEVVGDYPDMQVDGYEKTPDEANLNPDTNEYPDNDARTPIVQRQLSSEVLLCIFDTQIMTVDLHLKKEALHMGFDNSTGELMKHLRNEDGEQEGTPFAVSSTMDGNRNLNISALIDLMTSQANQQGITVSANENTINEPYQFTLQMMEGVPKVRFIVGT